MIAGLCKRLFLLTTVHQYPFIFIHREAMPIGPPIIEWLLAKVFQKKIIYDFDDAIWLTDNLTESKLEKWLRCRWKVASICKWSYKISCGNEYLAEFASRYNTSTFVNPTTIDLQKVDQQREIHIPDSTTETITIGWTGSHSTLKYLISLEPVLLSLEKKFPSVIFLLIADQKPKLNLKRWRFVKWNKTSEIKDLLSIDIGIMPLPDDEWTKGKCGFKALQYMALNIPAVVSPVGVNSKIISHGINGLLCTTHEEWLEALTTLILNYEIRIKLGAEGRKKVENHFCVDSNKSNFLSLFN